MSKEKEMPDLDGLEANQHVHPFFVVECPKDKMATVSLYECRKCSYNDGDTHWGGVKCLVAGAIKHPDGVKELVVAMSDTKQKECHGCKDLKSESDAAGGGLYICNACPGLVVGSWGHWTDDTDIPKEVNNCYKDK